MNSSQHKTLVAVFSLPVPKALEWRKSKEAKPYQVRAAREYLERLGVKP